MNRKYQVIYADPPWQYKFCSSASRKIENQYRTMNIRDIGDLVIPSDKSSVLYLWSTAPKLKEALEVMEKWGFEYKTNCCWDKKIIGMGYWFRNQHELLLVGTRGGFKPPNPDKRISSVFRSKREKHSKKPDAIRDLINDWFPGMSKLELFCRYPDKHWTSWGNEIDSGIRL